MEYANGGDLNHYLIQRQTKPLSNDEIFSIFGQICRGVQHLHSHGIVHGDLMPSNILLNFENNVATVKVADYLQNSQSQIYYSSPERLKSEQATEASDVWSLGVILFQMIKLRLPFLNVSDIASCKQVSFGEIPFCFKKVMSNCLNKNASSRITLTNIIRILDKRILERPKPFVKQLSSILSQNIYTNFDLDE